MDKYELFDKFLRGDLSGQETDELMLLLEDDEVGRELVEYSLETKLFVDYGKKVKSKISIGKTDSKIRKSKKRRKSLIPVLLMAALLSLAFLGYQFYKEKNRAVITGISVVEVSRDGAVVTSADEIKEGDTVAAQKASELIFKDGSSLKLSSGSKLEIKELVFNKIFVLKSGTVQVKAAAQDFGVLKIITSDAETVVVGTEFSVSKFKVGTLLKVQRGTVNFSNDSESLRVTEGQSVYADAGAGMIQTKNSARNFKWLLWNRKIYNDPDLYFYIDFNKGRPNANLQTGEILKDSEDNYFMRKGILSFEHSENFKIENDLTLFAWVKVAEPIVHAPVITKGDSSWRLQVNKLFPHAGFGGAANMYHFDSDFELSLNQWYMLHQVITEKSIKIYVNGMLVSEQTVSGVSLNNDRLVMIGGNSEKKGLAFPGDIGEAGLFKRALSQGEITEMFEAGKFTHLVK